MRRSYERRPRPRRGTQAEADNEALRVDRNRVRLDLGEQQLRVRQRITGILNPGLVTRGKQHADRDVDRLLRPPR